MSGTTSCFTVENKPHELMSVLSGRKADPNLSIDRHFSRLLRNCWHSRGDRCVYYQLKAAPWHLRLWLLLAIGLDEGLTLRSCIRRVPTKRYVYWGPTIVSPTKYEKVLDEAEWSFRTGHTFTVTDEPQLGNSSSEMPKAELDHDC